MKAGRAAQIQSITMDDAETNRNKLTEADSFEHFPADAIQLALMGRQKQRHAMRFIVETRTLATTMVNRVYRYLFSVVILKSVAQILHLIGAMVSP